MFYILILAMLICGTATSAASVYPDGGIVENEWTRGSQAHVAWDTSTFKGTVRIRLWNADSSKYTVIANSVAANLGEYSFTIPSSYPTGSRFRVRVEYQDSVHLYLMSRSFFRILPEASPLISSASSSADAPVQLEAFPNPSSGLVNVRWTASVATELVVHDVLGAPIARVPLAEGQSTCAVDLGQAPLGSYIISLRAPTGVVRTTNVTVHR